MIFSLFYEVHIKIKLRNTKFYTAPLQKIDPIVKIFPSRLLLNVSSIGPYSLLS